MSKAIIDPVDREHYTSDKNRYGKPVWSKDEESYLFNSYFHEVCQLRGEDDDYVGPHGAYENPKVEIIKAALIARGRQGQSHEPQVEAIREYHDFAKLDGRSLDLPKSIWVDEAGSERSPSHGEPYFRIQINRYLNDTMSMAIADGSILTPNSKNISGHHLRAINDWREKNKDALLDHWHGRMETETLMVRVGAKRVRYMITCPFCGYTHPRYELCDMVRPENHKCEKCHEPMIDAEVIEY
jgi:hypothetical protein